MKRILILEDRDEVYQELENFVTEVEPHAEFQRFKTFDALSNWFRTNFLQPEKEGLLTHPGSYYSKLLDDSVEIPLLICQAHLVSPSKKDLFKQLSFYFKAKKLLGPDRDRLGILFVATEQDEHFKPSDFTHPEIDNVLFRPFDHVVSVGKVYWALLGAKALGKVQIYAENPLGTIEMRKEAELIEISEIGFKTLNHRELSPGAIASYYSESHLQTSGQQGVFARCVESKPSKLKPSTFESTFVILGADNTTMRRIQLSVQKSMAELDVMRSKDKAPIEVAGLFDSDLEAKQIETLLKDSFENILLHRFESMAEMLAEVDPEASANEMVSRRFEVPSVMVVLDQTTDHLISVAPSLSGGDVFGIPSKEFSRLKRFLGEQVDDSQMMKLTRFLNQGTPHENFSMMFSRGGLPYAIVLEGRTYGADHKVSFVLRPANLAEARRLLSARPRRSKKLSALIVGERIASRREADFWERLRASQLRLYRLEREPLTSHETIKRFASFDENFIAPFDSRHLALHLKSAFPLLRHKDPRFGMRRSARQGPVDVATLVNLQRVSEIGLSLTYYRPIHPGRFRTFTLWDPLTSEKRPLLARCISYEKHPDIKDIFLNHFVFFACSERDNILIRRWLLEQYRHNKAPESA